MFLFIVCANAEVGNLLDRLDPVRKYSDDIVIFHKNNLYSCLYIAAAAYRDKIGENNIFRGYFIDDTKRKLIYSGQNGLHPRDDISLRGSYIHIRHKDGEVILKNDKFSIEPMFYFSSPRFCAVSSSIFLLTQTRIIAALKNTLNEKLAICSSWINGMGAQMINEKTIIKDIFFAPLMASIHISLQKRDLHLWCRAPKLAEVFNYNNYKTTDDYRDMVKMSAGRLAGLCAGIVGHKSFKVKLSLSGGLDSRCCLAGAITTTKMDNLYIHTNKNLLADYKVALALARQYNLELNRQYPTASKTGSPLNRWFICNAGKYHILYDNGAAGQTDILSVTGLGAECIKGQFGWRSLPMLAPIMRDNSKLFTVMPKNYLSKKPLLSRILHKCGISDPLFSRERGGLIYAEIKEWLDKMDISHKSRDVSEYLFTYFRNPAHTGSACHNSCRIYPLLDPDLVALAYSPARHWRYPEQSPSIITDLLICINPRLAAVKFADGAPVLNSDHINARVKFLGSAYLAAPYEVIGDPGTLTSGMSNIFTKLAEKAGFSGSFDYTDWHELALEGYEILSPHARKHFDFHIWRLQNDFPFKQRDNPWLWQIPAKLMSFLLAKN